MSIMYMARVAVFALASLCGAILVGIGASIEQLHWLTGAPAFASVAIAVGALTLLTLPAMVIIDFFISSDFVTSWIIVEIAVSTLLWILFASAAGTATTGYCFLYIAPIDICSRSHATAAFGYFAAFILIVYSLVLLIRAYMASRRGASVWGTSVKEAGFGGSGISMTQRV